MKFSNITGQAKVPVQQCAKAGHEKQGCALRVINHHKAQAHIFERPFNPRTLLLHGKPLMYHTNE
jgi:hypothetical protein